MPKAVARRPGPRARSRGRAVPRRRAIKAEPSRGSTARSRTPAPMPVIARHVEAEPAAIDEIDIGMAAVEKQRAVAAGLAAIGVAAGVAHDIGLGLDNAATGAPVLAVMHQDAADEKAGQRHRLSGEIIPAEPARRRNEGNHLINQCRTRPLPWREAMLCNSWARSSIMVRPEFIWLP